MNESEREELQALGRRHLENDELPAAVLCLVALLANDRDAADIAITHRGDVRIRHHVDRSSDPPAPAPPEVGRRSTFPYRRPVRDAMDNAQEKHMAGDDSAQGR